MAEIEELIITTTPPVTTVYDIIIIGAGASGYFAAIAAAEAAIKQSSSIVRPKILIVEKTSKPLAKVLISGGGRCNVTHNMPLPQLLADAYPRGKKELRAAFALFGQPATIAWFADHGVNLHAEPDGRMFPVTNQSYTIANCLQDAAYNAGVDLHLHTSISAIKKPSADNPLYQLETSTDTIYSAKAVVITTGGSNKLSGMQWLVDLGLEVTAPVPSLFTFNLPNHQISEALQGVSAQQVGISVPIAKYNTIGSVLITHWGISGFGTLRASSFAAFQLAEAGYKTEVYLNWLGNQNPEVTYQMLLLKKTALQKQLVTNLTLENLPKRLVSYLVAEAGLEGKVWQEVSTKQLRVLAQLLTQYTFTIDGKTTFKEEFVTAGGLKRSQFSFKSMEAKTCPGLFAAGEVLDIDGVTGGFNFQAAWTTGYLAGLGALDYTQTLTARN